MSRREALLTSLLFVIVLAIFAPGLDNDLVGDDLEWVRFGLSLRHNPGLVLSLFSGFVTPAMNATVGIDAWIGGAQAWVYNLTGLLFHLANVVMLAILLASALRATPRPADEPAGGKPAPWTFAAAWWAAAWWGLNYRHDEAVLWLGGRPHVLVITGILLALLLQRHWLAGGGWLPLLGCLAAGEFAILSKESGVMVAPIAAIWVALFTPEGISLFNRRRWAAPLGLAALVAVHALVLLSVRGEHQFYYQIDTSFVGRLAATHLAAAGIPVFDPPGAWLMLPAALLWAGIFAVGDRLARLGLLTMLLGTLPTVLIEFQPPRYRYFPLMGAACVVASLLAALALRVRTPRLVLAPLMALACAYLAAGVRNDEKFLEEAGRIHRVVRDAFCGATAGCGGASLAVVWRPATNGVDALREAANRDLLLPVRNYLPIYVRAAGIEGLADVATLASLCPDAVARSDSRIRRLSPADGARALGEEKMCVISYRTGEFVRDDPGAREALDAVATSHEQPKELLFDGRRWAVLKWGELPL